MNYIGYIIKEHRCYMGLNRKELSENICSEKYIYLIEKGERTPSAELVKLFSDRLGVDLFDYYQYLDCFNPIAVREHMNLFKMYHRKSDYLALKEATDDAFELQDFHNEPWSLEIKLNHLSYMVFVEKKYNETIEIANKVLDEIKPKYLNSIIVANFYILLSSCYQLTGDLANANSVLSLAYEMSHDKYKVEKYEQIVTSIKISKISFHYLNREFDDVIREGRELLKYQSEFNSYERIHYTYFYLAFAYYKIGAHDESIEWFKKGIYSLMHDYKPMDVYYIAMQDIFDVMIYDAMCDVKLISEFKKIYNLN